MSIILFEVFVVINVTIGLHLLVVFGNITMTHPVSPTDMTSLLQMMTDLSTSVKQMKDQNTQLQQESQQQVEQSVLYQREIHKQLQDMQTQSTLAQEQNDNIQVLIQQVKTDTLRITEESHQTLIEKLDQVNLKVDDIETHFNERLNRKVTEVKEEILDQVQARILLSEGAQNAATKHAVDGAVYSVRNLLTTQLINETVKIRTKIDQHEERLIVQEERVLGTLPNTVHLPRSLDLKMPMFKDEKQGSAYRFLRDVNDYFKLVPISNSLKLHVLPNMLDGNPKQWYHASRHKFTGFEDFEREFISRYCNDTVQFNIREQLIRNMYHPKSGSKTEHLIRQVLCNQDLKDPFPDDQLVTVVLRHYDSNTQQVLLARNVNNVTDMEKVLIQLDQVPSSQVHKSEVQKQVDTKATSSKPKLNEQGLRGGQQRFVPYNRPTQNISQPNQGTVSKQGYKEYRTKPATQTQQLNTITVEDVGKSKKKKQRDNDEIIQAVIHSEPKMQEN